jgi:hypothetical protein
MFLRGIKKYFEAEAPLAWRSVGCLPRMRVSREFPFEFSVNMGSFRVRHLILAGRVSARMFAPLDTDVGLRAGSTREALSPAASQGTLAVVSRRYACSGKRTGGLAQPREGQVCLSSDVRGTSWWFVCVFITSTNCFETTLMICKI